MNKTVSISEESFKKLKLFKLHYKKSKQTKYYIRRDYKKGFRKMLMASEETEQTIFVNWFRDNYPECIIFAIPNGGSRNLKEAVNLKKSGVLKGTPDLCILLLNKNYIY